MLKFIDVYTSLCYEMASDLILLQPHHGKRKHGRPS